MLNFVVTTTLTCTLIHSRPRPLSHTSFLIRLLASSTGKPCLRHLTTTLCIIASLYSFSNGLSNSIRAPTFCWCTASGRVRTPLSTAVVPAITAHHGRADCTWMAVRRDSAVSTTLQRLEVVRDLLWL